MGKRPGKTILLIESDLEEARSIHEMIDAQGLRVFNFVHRESIRDAEEYLTNNSVDIVLLDLESIDPPGLGAVRQVHTAAPQVSLVLLSDLKDEATAVQAFQEGAQDYLIKGQIEPRELIRALVNSIEHKQIEKTIFSKMNTPKSHSPALATP